MQRDGEETALPGKQHVPSPDFGTGAAVSLQAGLAGAGAAAGRGHGQPLQKHFCTFGGPQVSRHQAEIWYGHPLRRGQPKGTCCWVAGPGGAWTIGGRRMHGQSGTATSTQRCPLCTCPCAERSLHVSFLPISEASIQLRARAQHPRGMRSLTWMRKDVPPIASSVPQEQVGNPGPSSPHPFSCSGTAPRPGLRSLAGC